MSSYSVLFLRVFYQKNVLIIESFLLYYCHTSSLSFPFGKNAAPRLIELLLQCHLHHTVMDSKLCFVTVGAVLCLGPVVRQLLVVCGNAVLLWLSWRCSCVGGCVGGCVGVDPTFICVSPGNSSL